MTNIIDNDFHPVDSDLSATDDHWGSTSKSMPDFSGKITGRNNASNNWEDQRNVDNYTRNAIDIGSASYNKPVSPYAMDLKKKK